MFRLRMFGLLAAFSGLAATSSFAADILPGPVEAEILSVYDGDTFTARVHIWIRQFVDTAVRVEGMDTPEIKGECQAEADLAVKARDRAVELLGTKATLSDIRNDKYGGRVDAIVTLQDGRRLSDVLISEKLARPYSGGNRTSWCE